MKPLTKLTVIALLFFLSACTEYEKVGTANSGGERFEIICIDSVEYLLKREGYAGFMSPHFKPDGSLYSCVNR